MKTLCKEEVIFEVLQATGLNWTVAKVPLQYAVNDGEKDVVYNMPEQFANVRSDTKQSIGCVGSNYSVLQNHEMVELVYDAGAEVFDQNGTIKHPWNNAETLGTLGNMAGGSLKGGSAVFVQLSLPDAYVGKSDIKRFITITNTHNGFKSLGFGTANQVICCKNTFAIAMAELSKIRHTDSMREKVNAAVKSLRKMLDFEEQQIEIFEKASKITYDASHKKQVLEMVFGKDVVNSTEKIPTRTENRMFEFANDVITSSQEQGETLWALFNSVTRFTNHTTHAKDKDYSLLFGPDADTNLKAYKLLESWVN